MDMDAFMSFVGKFAGDLGAVVAAGNVVLGDRLGLYRALADGGPQTAAASFAGRGTRATRRPTGSPSPSTCAARPGTPRPWRRST